MVDVTATPGIAEYLAEKASLDEVVRQDRHSPAHVIPAGERMLSPTALLASDRMKELLQELKRSYDLVVVDTPPVLAVSDARVLTRYVDTTVFVVRWVETPRKLAMAALRQFNNAGAEVAGILLSMVDAKKHAQYSYSDSGYFHGRVTKYYVE
jgi:capsular exopolysaccharide synthesis family protein